MLNNFDIRLRSRKSIRHTKNRLMEIVCLVQNSATFPANVRKLMDRARCVSNFFPANFSRRPIVSRLSTFATNITHMTVSRPIAIDWRLCRKKCFDDSDNPNDEAQTVREIFSVTVLGTVFFLFFFIPRISLTAGFFSSLFCFFHFGFTTFIALTLIFTVNTCIVLFLQLQSRARSARCFKFLFVSRLSGVSRGRSLLCGFFFFVLFLSTVFFSWERAVTLDNGR